MKVFFSFFLCLLIMGTAFADDDIDYVEKSIKTKLNAMILILEKDDITQQEKESRIIEIISPLFDFSKMAKLALGKKYWPGLSKKEKKEYSDIFIKRLKESYVNKFNLYTDEKINYKTPLRFKKKIHFPIELISKNNSVTMLCKFYKSKRGWIIYDAEIQGVSVISTYRSQFDQVLRKGSIDDLIIKLQQMDTESGDSLNPDKEQVQQALKL